MTTNRKQPNPCCIHYNFKNFRCEHPDEGANVICRVVSNLGGLCGIQERPPKPPPPPPPPPKK